MKKAIVPSMLQVIGLGIVTGMRSAMGPAFTSYAMNQRPSDKLRRSPLGFMQQPTTARVLKTLAAGELVVDKSPGVGNRIAATGIAGRALSGALAGATLYQAKGGKAWKGGLLGAAVAVAAAYAFFYLRREAGRKFKIKDAALGGVEDAMALGIASASIRK